MASSDRIWFGNEKLFQWAPCPLAGVTVNNIAYTEGATKQNGGLIRVRSPRYSKRYNLSFTGLARDLDGINVYNKYASGLYAPEILAASGVFSRSKVYFADPYAFETNLFSAEWAAPGLTGVGWKPITTHQFPSASYSGTPVSNRPNLLGVLSVQSAANATPLTDPKLPYIIIPIPPTHTLWYGFNASVGSGTPVIRVEGWVNGASGPAFTSTPTLIADGSTTILNGNLPGSTYAYAKIYATRTTSAASTLFWRTSMAQLWPNGVAPLLAGNWLPGEGNKGLVFADDAIVEDYRYMYPPRKGISTTLEEVN